MATSSVAYSAVSRRPLSGEITCYEERTDHVLSTQTREVGLTNREPGTYRPGREESPRGEAHHATHHPDIARSCTHRSAGARFAGSCPAAASHLEAGPAAPSDGLDAGAHRPAAGAQGARRDPRGEDQAP